MTPSLKQVSVAINIICKSSNIFTPSMVRQLLGRDFPTTEPAMLSAQIQPHLRVLREAGIVRIKTTTQRRNRPHQLINRELLIEITVRDEFFTPQQVSDSVTQSDELEDSDDLGTVSQDEATNTIINMELRLLALEETVELLVEKLNAVGTVLRP